MVWPAIGFAISLIPNVYYGLTQGQWGYGWDYVITGHDYVGQALDDLLGLDDDYVDEEGWESGLTDGDYGFLMDMFANIEELITIGIVVSLLAFVVFALFRRS